MLLTGSFLKDQQPTKEERTKDGSQGFLTSTILTIPFFWCAFVATFVGLKFKG